eukprot:7570503-Pyramimonas_sp.AAC.1
MTFQFDVSIPCTCPAPPARRPAEALHPAASATWQAGPPRAPARARGARRLPASVSYTHLRAHETGAYL